MNDFENIRPPANIPREPLLCCDKSKPRSKPRRQVRLFYADGSMSNVLEVDLTLLHKATRSYCVVSVLATEPPWVYSIPGSHHFLKVKDVQGLEAALGLEKVQRIDDEDVPIHLLT